MFGSGILGRIHEIWIVLPAFFKLYRTKEQVGRKKENVFLGTTLECDYRSYKTSNGLRSVFVLQYPGHNRTQS